MGSDVFGGLQSLLFYTAITWLPTLGQLAGLSNDATGFLASVFSFISLPLAMTIPSLTTRLSAKKRLRMIALFSATGMVGLGMLLGRTDSFVYWLILNCYRHVCQRPLPLPHGPFLSSLKTSTPEQTAQLSGLAQTGGYILAAFGPSLFGYSFDLFHSWTPAILILIGLAAIVTLTLFYIEI